MQLSLSYCMSYYYTSTLWTIVHSDDWTESSGAREQNQDAPSLLWLRKTNGDCKNASLSLWTLSIISYFTQQTQIERVREPVKSIPTPTEGNRVITDVLWTSVTQPSQGSEAKRDVLLVKANTLSQWGHRPIRGHSVLLNENNFSASRKVPHALELCPWKHITQVS